MQANLLTQILGNVSVAAISGIAGAAWQIHRRRARPFVLLTSIDGEALKTTQSVAIPDDILTELETTTGLHKPTLPFDLSDVHGVVATIESAQEWGPKLQIALRQSIAALQPATDAVEVLKAIVPALSLGFFDDFLSNGLVRGTIQLEEPPPDLPEKVQIRESKDRGGHLQLALPGAVLQFGARLDEVPVLRDLLRPLVHALSRAHGPTIRKAFESMLAALGKELQATQSILPRIHRLREENSRWQCKLYLANYGETAMLILPDGWLEIAGAHSERPLREPCRLVVYGEIEGESVTMAEDNGLLVSPGAEQHFFFVTSHLQKEMQRGNEIRGRFEDGRARARIVFECVSAGLRPRRWVGTHWRPFRASIAGA